MAIAFTAFDRAFNLGPPLLIWVFVVIVASGAPQFGALGPRSIAGSERSAIAINLLHRFVIWILVQQLPRILHPDARESWIFLPLLALSTCLLIIISSMTYLYIEKPSINGGKKTLHWLRQNRRGQKKLSEKVVPQR